MRVEAALAGGMKRSDRRGTASQAGSRAWVAASGFQPSEVGPGARCDNLARARWLPTLCARVGTLLLAAGLAGSPAPAQQVTAGPQTAPSLQTSVLLQPTLNELRSTIAGLRIAKWKAPGPVKEEAQGNAGSIDRDLQNTLPGLISQADTPPQSVANSFAVYRNLDALYEVLLRVSGTAELAAPDDEAANVAHSLLTLDAARRALGDSIAASSRAEEAALAQKASQPTPATAPASPPQTTVVADGPGTPPAHRKPKVKPKPAPPPATPQT